MLPSGLKVKAERQASTEGVSLGGLVREALVHYLAQPTTVEEDPLFADDAVFSGPAPEDYSQRHDAYLYGDKE